MQLAQSWITWKRIFLDWLRYDSGKSTSLDGRETLTKQVLSMKSTSERPKARNAAAFSPLNMLVTLLRFVAFSSGLMIMLT